MRLDIVTSANFTNDLSFKATMLDITITNASAASNLSSSKSNPFIPGFASESAATTKHKTYDDKIRQFNAAHPNRQLNFIPFAIEVQGKFSTEAMKVFNKIISDMSPKRHLHAATSSYFLRKISVSLQNHVSKQIIDAKEKLLHIQSDNDNLSPAFFIKTFRDLSSSSQ